MADKPPIDDGSWQNIWWGILGLATAAGGWWKSARSKKERPPNGELAAIRGQIVALNGRIGGLDSKIDEIGERQEATARHISWMAGKLGYEPFKE